MYTLSLVFQSYSYFVSFLFKRQNEQNIINIHFYSLASLDVFFCRNRLVYFVLCYCRPEGTFVPSEALPSILCLLDLMSHNNLTFYVKQKRLILSILFFHNHIFIFSNFINNYLRICILYVFGREIIPTKFIPVI